MATKEILSNFDFTNTAANGPAVKQNLKDLLIGFLTTNPTILTQTSDTGQLTEAAIDALTFPIATGTGVNLGYWIFKFDDGYTPFYIRFEIGPVNGATQTNFTMNVTLGRGTNGAGTITGQFGIPNMICYYGLAASNGFLNTYNMLCVRTGYFGMAFKTTAVGINTSLIHLSRPVDSNNIIVDGLLSIFVGENSTASTTYINQGYYTVSIGGLPNTTIKSVTNSTSITTTLKELILSPPPGFFKNNFNASRASLVSEFYSGYPQPLKDPNFIIAKYNSFREVFIFDNRTWLSTRTFMTTFDGISTNFCMRWE